MPDLHALLDDASRRPPAADPVGAVHARVRRRAARRRSAVTAGTASALVVAGLAWSARTDLGGVSPAHEPTPTPTAAAEAQPGPEWRLHFSAGTNRPREHWDEFAAVKNYVLEHPDVFGHFDEITEDSTYTTILSLAPGVDRAVWEARVRELAGALPIRFERCPLTPATLDRVRAEVEAAVWPSGTRLMTDPYMMSDPSFGPCTLLVELEGDLTEADKAYARERWGDEIGLLGSMVVEM